jgi:hypothetical protein
MIRKARLNEEEELGIADRVGSAGRHWIGHHFRLVFGPG